jgi:sulfite dehydrogenase
MKTRRTLVPLFALIASGLGALEIMLPPDTARLTESPLPGYALATAHCYTCHSVDYVATQPVSSRTYWKSAVTKMQKTFGAPIPDPAVDPLVDYLVKTYGNERAAAPAAASPVRK